MHSWDIAAATGGVRDLGAPLLGAAQQMVEAVPEHQLRRPGFFGPAIVPAPGSSATDQLMAFMGRELP